MAVLMGCCVHVWNWNTVIISWLHQYWSLWMPLALSGVTSSHGHLLTTALKKAMFCQRHWLGYSDLSFDILLLCLNFHQTLLFVSSKCLHPAAIDGLFSEITVRLKDKVALLLQIVNFSLWRFWRLDFRYGDYWIVFEH